MLAVINIILGAALLVAGRRLFWLFILAGGFIAGVQFATAIIKGPEWLTILIGIGVGVVFAIFARFFQKIVIVVAGFFLGGSILSGFIGALGIDVTWLSWIIGGLIGVLLVSILFDWALISLSSIGGAVLLVQSFNLGNPVRGVAFIVLLFFGFFIQATSMRKEKKTSNEVAK